ncbi:hypothetical protein HK100_007112, partial [Physocladia obscura]
MSPQTDAEATNVVAEDLVAIDGYNEPTNMEFPDGGRQAWIVVAGSFVAHFVVYGAVYSFGIYNSYYNNLQIGSAFQVAMIGSVGPGVLDGIGILSGFLAERFGYQPMIFIGSIILSLGLLLSSFTITIPYLILTQ